MFKQIKPERHENSVDIKRHLLIFCVCSVDSQYCVQEEVILTENSVYTSQKTQDGLFCIYKDNSKYPCSAFFSIGMESDLNFRVLKIFPISFLMTIFDL